jgi:hypothetical protein
VIASPHGQNVQDGNAYDVEIVDYHCRRGMMKRDTALRLAKFFGTDAQSWIKLQTPYDLAIAQETLAERLEKEVVTYQGLTSSGLSERM